MSDTLKELVAEGLTADQIGEKLGISTPTVWRRLAKSGLKTKRAWDHVVGDEKTCSRCGKKKPLNQFPTAGVAKDDGKYRRKSCWDCYNSMKQSRRRSMRSWFEGFKKQLCCEQCGNNDFRVLEFHHEDPNEKEQNIANIVTSGRWSREHIMDEVKKCRVLCANCHRIHHYEERNGA